MAFAGAPVCREDGDDGAWSIQRSPIPKVDSRQEENERPETQVPNIIYALPVQFLNDKTDVNFTIRYVLVIFDSLTFC